MGIGKWPNGIWFPKGPVLSVKVGSYRYDPLSELYDAKFSGPRILLEMRHEATCDFGRCSDGFSNSLHGGACPGEDQRARIFDQYADEARRLDDGNDRTCCCQQLHRS